MEKATRPQPISPDALLNDGNKNPLQSSFAAGLRRIMPLLIAVIGLILMGIGIFIKTTKVDQKVAANSQEASLSLISEKEFSRKLILVDVGGAVEQPGIVEIQNDSRIRDVLISAGGLSAKADRTYISKNINLAQRAFDGMKLYFPFEGESFAQIGDVGKNIAGKNETTTINRTGLVDGQVNINSASAAELESLPGVGPVTAGKIVAARPYQTVSELLSRKIVGKSVYEKIKEFVIVD